MSNAHAYFVHPSAYSRHGHRLQQQDSAGNLLCPESGWRYQENDLGQLRCLDWSEAQALPT
jgi:UDP-2-acetamido-3-amino-2,3-dideoxy-glucuronate N-acetyltransferase